MELTGRTEHCSSFRDNGNGRCIADCHYNKPFYSVSEDCIGNTGKSMHGPNHFEQKVTVGFIDGTHKEVIHEDGTWKVVGIYQPDVNKDCSWGMKSSTETKQGDTAAKLTAFNTKQQNVGRSVHP